MASITCGNCTRTHESVDAVRSCYAMTHRRSNSHSKRTALEKQYIVDKNAIRSGVKEAGIYKDHSSGTIYKVQLAVHGSGRLYAKKLVVHPEDKTATFVYEPGAIYRISASDKMTLEDAKAFGALYGCCVRCGRTLTDEQSIAAGIGPICAGRW